MEVTLADILPDFSFEKNGDTKSSTPKQKNSNKKTPETPPKMRGPLGVIQGHCYSPTKGNLPTVTEAINELAGSLDEMHRSDKVDDDVKTHVTQRTYKAIRTNLSPRGNLSTRGNLSSSIEPYPSPHMTPNHKSSHRERLARNHKMLTEDPDYKKIAKHLNMFPDDGQVIGVNVNHITHPEVREFSPSMPPRISGGHELSSDDFKALLTTPSGAGLGVLSLPLPSSQSSSSSSAGEAVKFVKGHKTFFPFDGVDHISRIATNMSRPLGTKGELSLHVYTDPKGKEWLIGACHKQGSLHTAFPIIVINAADVGFEDYSVKNLKGEVLTIRQEVLQEAAKKGGVFATITYKGKEYDLIDIADFLTRNKKELDTELLKTIPDDILSIPKSLLAAVPGKAAQIRESKRIKKEAGLALAATIKVAALAKAECEEESCSDDEEDHGIGNLFIH